MSDDDDDGVATGCSDCLRRSLVYGGGGDER
jgi:hypothetical protein